MEEIERFIKITQQRRLANQRELDRLDADSEYKELMKELRDLKKERKQCEENIAKHLNAITAHKHTIYKNLHSSDVSGLPVPRNYAQDIQAMLTDVIDFLNNIGDTYKKMNNVEENSVDPMKLSQTVTTCTEAIGNTLYQTRSCIAQLEILKNPNVLHEYILNSNNSSNDSSDDINDEIIGLTNISADSEPTVK